MELEWRLKVFSRTSNLRFWIAPHQGTLSCFHILKLTWHMLSIVYKVGPFNFFHCIHSYFHHVSQLTKKMHCCLIFCLFFKTSIARGRLVWMKFIMGCIHFNIALLILVSFQLCPRLLHLSNLFLILFSIKLSLM